VLLEPVCHPLPPLGNLLANLLINWLKNYTRGSPEWTDRRLGNRSGSQPGCALALPSSTGSSDAVDQQSKSGMRWGAVCPDEFRGLGTCRNFVRNFTRRERKRRCARFRPESTPGLLIADRSGKAAIPIPRTLRAFGRPSSLRDPITTRDTHHIRPSPGFAKMLTIEP